MTLSMTMSENIILLKKYLPALTESQLEQFQKLQPLYENWNAQINVISRKDMEHFFTHHVLHSLAIAKVISFKPGTEIIDIGTGGGFPGIPLAIFFPEVKFHLVDSIGKKIKVVNEVVHALELENVKAEKMRAEEIKKQYDFIISRAVAPWNEIEQWTKKLVKEKSSNELQNGWLLLKGGDLKVEFSSAKNRMKEFAISDFFEKEYFAGKKVVWVGK